VTGLLANDPNEIGEALGNLKEVVDDVTSFVVENREALGTTSDKLASVSNAVVENLDDIKQALHVAPTALQNFLNIYAPAQNTWTGVLGLNNFSNTVQFLCSAVQAASRLGAEQSAKLCVQYLAPIIKNRQVNFLPLGENLFNGAMARPNELTYSEDWLRPDFIPPPGPPPAGAPTTAAPPPSGRLPPPNPIPTDPAAGLPGLMVPRGAGQ
jgi:phospholipid/cholesterol/gamma-HCH transport system substrate-binding protein